MIQFNFFLLHEDCGISFLHVFLQYFYNRSCLPNVTLHCQVCSKDIYKTAAVGKRQELHAEKGPERPEGRDCCLYKGCFNQNKGTNSKWVNRGRNGCKPGDGCHPRHVGQPLVCKQVQTQVIPAIGDTGSDSLITQQSLTSQFCGPVSLHMPVAGHLEASLEIKCLIMQAALEVLLTWSAMHLPLSFI